MRHERSLPPACRASAGWRSREMALAQAIEERWLHDTPASSDRTVPWQVTMLTPSGHVEIVEVRSPTASLALDTVQSWKPCHQVATDPRGNPLIRTLPGTPREEGVRREPGRS